MAFLSKILIIAYYRFSDPVFRSAVLPYFTDFPNKNRFLFYLITFEDQGFEKLDTYTQQKEKLKKHNIQWIPVYRLRWRIPLIDRLFEFLFVFFKSVYLINKEKIRGVYSEGFPTAMFGYAITSFTNTKHLIHTFEPHADYMREGKTWGENSWKYQMMKRSEIIIAKNAYRLFTGTNEYISVLESKGVDKNAVIRMPSCIDTNIFRFSAKDRREVREKLGIEKDQKLVCCLGKFGGMYFKEETFELFSTFASSSDYKFRFLIITPLVTKEIESLINSYGLGELTTCCSLSKPKEVSAYLSASDIGLVGVRQKPSKRYCSPIKTGEYLACGLPVIVPKGISDDDVLLKENGIGVLISDANKIGYEDAVKNTICLFDTTTDQEVRKKARNYSIKDRSIYQYKLLYEKLFQSL